MVARKDDSLDELKTGKSKIAKQPGKGTHDAAGKRRTMPTAQHGSERRFCMYQN